MGTDFDEAELVVRSTQGDLDAFNRLVEHYQRPLYNFCLRMLSSAEAGEDATQEAFIAAFRAIHRFRGAQTGGFRAWLFRIAANACYDEMRRRKSKPSLSLDAPRGESGRGIDVPDAAPTMEQHVETTELGGAIQAALDTLPSDQRLAVILCDVQGMEYAEIALVMGVSLGTVKSRINRARTRLRDRLLARGELLPSRFRPSTGDR